ncbi:MAG TPA: DUF488 domain-containing protein [Candidatus Acidoferrales bacterium]|jgi:uncharacterized protein (DUF488 family)|nr:DUF488 domain-containing protein [Candidatus Acidoferrales bacterium]
MSPSNHLPHRLFTIGHSNQEISDLLGTLIRHEIHVVCDVRSRPGSFRFPQFNREPLMAQLASAKIIYQFFGDQFGGRPLDPRYYLPHGLVDYAARRKAPDFEEALDRLLGFVQSKNVVIMCAEEDPLHCHRFLLICPALVQRGIVPSHLRRGATLETQRDAEDRLLQLHGFADVTSNSLFSQGRAGALEDALRLQSEQYGFRSSPEAIEYF